MTDIQASISAADEELRKGNFKNAAYEYSKALKINDTNSLLFAKRAWTRMKLEEYDLALSDFNRAIELDSNNAHYYSERGVVKLHLGTHDLAMLDFDYAISLEPNYGYRYACRAFLKDKIGDVEGAVADYEQAILLDPEDAISYNNLGLLQEKAGFNDKAKYNFDSADKLAEKLNLFGDMVSTNDEDSILSDLTIVADKGESNDQLKHNNDLIVPNYFSSIKKVFSSKTHLIEFVKFVFNGFKLKE